MTRETVIGETPACRATSRIVIAAVATGAISVPQLGRNLNDPRLDSAVKAVLSVPRQPVRGKGEVMRQPQRRRPRRAVVVATAVLAAAATVVAVASAGNEQKSAT